MTKAERSPKKGVVGNRRKAAPKRGVPALRKRAEEALREPEAKYKTLFASAAEGILVADLKTKQFRYANPALCRMFGYTEEALMRLGVADIHPKESLDHVLAEFEAQARGEKTLAPDLPCLRKDGTLFYANVSAALAVLDGHKCNVGFFTDVTELKHAETALKESERKIRALFDQSFQFIGMMTPDGTLIEANKTAMQFAGIDESDCLGKPFWNTPWWAHSAELQNKLRESVIKVARGESVRFEATHLAADGSLHYVDFSLKPFKDETGKVIFLIPEGRDITESKQAEEALRETNEYLDNLFNYANAPIIVWNPQFRIARFNHAFEFLTGRRAKDVIGKSLEILFPPDLAESSMEYIRRTKTGERWDVVEIKIQHIDGSVWTVLWNSATLFSPDGKTPVATIAQGQDITLRKQAEEALKRANEDLVQMSRVKADFTSMVSHELRTPLASIKEAIAIVLDGIDGPVNDEQRETLGYARESVDRLAKLINDVLDFSKMETGKVEMSFEESDMGELAERVYRSMKLTADKEGVDLQLSIPDHGVYANCDAEKFEQVLVNLLGNAINFTKRGGRVDLRLRALDDRVAFEVEDTGIGIEEEDMGKIFEAFGQARRAGARKPGGTGLGLSISKQIVDAHGGEIAVESIPGKGTRFIVSIPYGVRGRA